MGYTLRDKGLVRVQGWQLKFCWLPQTCFLTGKYLWFKYAYYGVSRPATPVLLGLPEAHYWISVDEFIIWNLKNEYI